jgi:hypothetical protein
MAIAFGSFPAVYCVYPFHGVMNKPLASLTIHDILHDLFGFLLPFLIMWVCRIVTKDWFD